MKPREFMTFGALCFRVGDSEGEMTIKKGTSCNGSSLFYFESKSSAY